VTAQAPHGGDLAGLPFEVSGTPLPGCNPPWWLSDAEMRAHHALCVSPEEALDLETGRRLMLACPCDCHTGAEPPTPYRPAPGPNYEAVRPFLEGRTWPPSYRGWNPR